MMSESWFGTSRMLGMTGLKVSRIGLASGYGIGQRAVERAFSEYGINYFYWDRRKPGMRSALDGLARSKRDEIVIAVQSYDHTGWFLRRSAEKALHALRLEYADILFMGWVNKRPAQRLLDEAARLKEESKIRFLGMTGHNRKFHGEMATLPGAPFDVLQIRYNAAHRGAETEVFSKLTERRPGIVTYTATRWGRLLQAKRMPRGEAPLTAAECYRFVLTHRAVDLCLAGPKTEEQMEEGFRALAEGPLDEQALRRIRKIGDHVHG